MWALALAAATLPANAYGEDAQAPVPAAGSEQLSLSLVRCSNRFDCWLADTIMPASARSHEREIIFADRSGARSASEAATLARSNAGDHQLTLDVISIAREMYPRSRQAGISAVPIAIDVASIPSDRYAGRLQLSFDGVTDPVTIPLELEVRDGPLVPLVLILIGVLLGRFVAYWKRTGKREAELLDDIDLLEEVVAGDPPRDRDSIAETLREAREQLLLGELNAAERALRDVASRRELLAKARRFEEAFGDDERVETLRRLVGAHADDEARALADALTKALRSSAGREPGVKADPPGGIPALAGLPFDGIHGEAVGDNRGDRKRSIGHRITRAAALVAGAAGSIAAWFERRHRGLAKRRRRLAQLRWLARLLDFAAVFGLVVLGMQTLYVDGGVTLGAQPLADYAVLLFWGMGSQVMTKNVFDVAAQLRPSTEEPGRSTSARPATSGSAAALPPPRPSPSRVELPVFDLDPEDEVNAEPGSLAEPAPRTQPGPASRAEPRTHSGPEPRVEPEIADGDDPGVDVEPRIELDSPSRVGRTATTETGETASTADSEVKAQLRAGPLAESPVGLDPCAFPLPYGLGIERKRSPLDVLELEAMHRRGLDGRGVKVAVVDTGVSRRQRMLAHDRIEALDIRPGRSGDDRNGHGTCMVGILASDVGICPEASIVSIRALDSRGVGDVRGLRRAVEIALEERCDVISISAGQRQRDAVLEELVEDAVAGGTVVVAAIRKQAPYQRAYPAAYDDVIAVTPSRDGRLVYRSPGAWVSCAAPGVDIPTYALGRRQRTRISGSSPATAVTAGVCALLLSGAPPGDERRDLARRMRRILVRTGRPRDGGRLLDPKLAARRAQV